MTKLNLMNSGKNNIAIITPNCIDVILRLYLTLSKAKK